MKTFKISYQNSGFELLIRLFVWAIAMFLILPIPWAINDSMSYFSKGFTIYGQE